MSTLFILLVQTRSEATIAILSLLLVATIVGYATALVYYKSIYIKIIKAIKSEKNELKDHNVNLTADKNKLLISIREKDNEIEHLTMEVNALKTLHMKAVQETGDITFKNMRTEQLQYEKR
jgi:uncharacterized membrane protein (DUF106 family)